MKKMIILKIILTAFMLSACQKSETVTSSASYELKVAEWGPKSSIAGSNPNLQPDGTMGIWIEVADTKGLGNASVYFGGKVAQITVIQDKLITAGIAPDQLKMVGENEVAVKQNETGRLLPIGIFKVVSK